MLPKKKCGVGGVGWDGVLRPLALNSWFWLLLGLFSFTPFPSLIGGEREGTGKLGASCSLCMYHNVQPRKTIGDKIRECTPDTDLVHVSQNTL